MSLKRIILCIIFLCLIVLGGTWLFFWMQVQKTECSIVSVQMDYHLTDSLRKTGRKSAENQESYNNEKDQFYAYPSKHFPEEYFRKLSQTPDCFFGLQIGLHIKNNTSLMMKDIQLDTGNADCLWQGIGIVFDGYRLDLPYYQQGHKETDEYARVTIYEPEGNIAGYLDDPVSLKLFLSFQLGLFRFRVPMMINALFDQNKFYQDAISCETAQEIAYNKIKEVWLDYYPNRKAPERFDDLVWLPGITLLKTYDYT